MLCVWEGHEAWLVWYHLYTWWEAPLPCGDPFGPLRCSVICATRARALCCPNLCPTHQRGFAKTHGWVLEEAPRENCHPQAGNWVPAASQPRIPRAPQLSTSGLLSWPSAALFALKLVSTGEEGGGIGGWQRERVTSHQVDQSFCC